MTIRCLWFAVVSALLSATSLGEVMDSAGNGFSVKHSTVIAATRDEVYDVAVRRISEWWSSDHTISGDAGNLYIDAKPHGCFCERLGPDAGLIHLALTFVNPGTMLRFTGGLGPLGLMGVSGNMTWEFEDHEDGMQLTLNYAVGGYLDGGLDAIAEAVDGVLVEQIENLKKLVEAGKERHSDETARGHQLAAVANEAVMPSHPLTIRTP